MTRRAGRWAAGTALAAVFVGAAAWAWLRPAVDASRLATVARGPLTVTLTTTGTLRPLQALTYRSPVPGREIEIVALAPEGTRVEAGDLVARLDTTELALELDRARDEARQAQLDLEVAEGEFEEAKAAVRGAAEGEGALNEAEVRTRLQVAERKAGRLRQEHATLEPLLKRGVITAEELGRTASALEQAEEELALAQRRTEVMQGLTRPRERARAELQRAQKESQLGRARLRVGEAATRIDLLQKLVDGCSLYAQRAGMVVYEEYLNASPRRKIRVGDRVTSSQGIVTIPEVSRMLVEGSVGETDVHRVAPGQPARVHVEALGGTTLTGTVARVGTLASASVGRPLDDRRFDLVIELDTSDDRLRPEMTARADIAVTVKPDVLLVPVAAIADEGGRLVVRVARPRGLDVRPVTLGDANDTVAEVLTGLTAGERVVLPSPAASPAEAAALMPRAPGAVDVLAPR